MLQRARLFRGDAGFALATTLFMVLAAFATVSVGVMATMQTQSGTVRDQDTKSALASAEAGVEQALFRYNAYTRLPSEAQPCIQPSGTALAAASPQAAGPDAGWCPPVSGTSSSGSFTYEVCPGSATSPCNRTEGSMLIVANSNVDGVTRRIEQTVLRADSQAIFANAQVQAQSYINAESNSQILANAATNGDITLGSGADLCGPSTVGPGHHITVGPGGGYFNGHSGRTCTAPADPTTATQQTITLPPVNQGDAPTNNDNYRITNALSNANPKPTPADAIDGSKNGVQWDASARTLNIRSNSSLTLTGTTYSLCTLALHSSSNLYIQSGAAVNIFFDSPEACHLPANSTQLDLNSAGRITTNTGVPSTLAMYFVGSPSIPTKISVNSSFDVNKGCVDNFVIYAPYTGVTFQSGSQFCGAVAAKSVDLKGGSTRIVTDEASKSFRLANTLSHYTRSQYVECSAQPTSPPNFGC